MPTKKYFGISEQKLEEPFSFSFNIKLFHSVLFVYFCMVATSIPRCYRAAMVHGFVEELVVNEDPEYQWIDRIRTPRASNEARQRLISLMSGKKIYSNPDFKFVECSLFSPLLLM